MENKPTFKFQSQCEECGLIIKSDSKSQYLYNKQQHIDSHKRKVKSHKEIKGELK